MTHSTRPWWREALLHVLGDCAVYRLSTTVSTNLLLLPAYKLAAWRKDGGDARTSWYGDLVCNTELNVLGVPRRRSQALRAVLDELDGLDAVKALPGLLEALEALRAEGLVVRSGDSWSLTMAGLELAVEVRPVFSDKNLTNRWVEHHVNADYMGRLSAALARKCPRSVQFGELDDLIQHYLTAIIRRNGLRKRIVTGRPPAFCDIKQWVYNAALSMWRDEGRDAQTRGFKGARTEKDLRQDNDDDVVSRSIPGSATAIYLIEGDDGEGAFASSSGMSMPLLDVAGGNFEDEMIHTMSFNRGFERAAAVIQRSGRPSAERNARLLRSYVDGATSGEIATLEGTSRNHAVSLLGNLRGTLSTHGSIAKKALRVFAYLQANPYSTRLDMESAINDSEAATDGGLGESIPKPLLDALVKAGRIKAIGRGDAECFWLTRSGAAVLSEGDYFGVDLDVHAEASA